MNDTYKCPYCYEVFNNETVHTKQIRRQTMWEPAEYQDICPRCGADADDADECRVCECCGEGFVDTEMIETDMGEYCPECTKTAYPELYAEYEGVA